MNKTITNLSQIVASKKSEILEQLESGKIKFARPESSCKACFGTGFMEVWRGSHKFNAKCVCETEGVLANEEKVHSIYNENVKDLITCINNAAILLDLSDDRLNEWVSKKFNCHDWTTLEINQLNKMFAAIKQQINAKGLSDDLEDVLQNLRA